MLDGIVGNMGEPLEHGSEEDEAEDAVVDAADALTVVSGEDNSAESSTMQQSNEYGIDEVCEYTSHRFSS